MNQWVYRNVQKRQILPYNSAPGFQEGHEQITCHLKCEVGNDLQSLLYCVQQENELVLSVYKPCEWMLIPHRNAGEIQKH